MENYKPRRRINGKTSQAVQMAMERGAEAHVAEARAVAKSRVNLGRFGRGEAAKYKGRKASDEAYREFWSDLPPEPAAAASAAAAPAAPAASRSRKTVRKCVVVSSGGGEPTTGYKTTTTTRRKPYKPTSV
jgi:hypothetical protein